MIDEGGAVRLVRAGPEQVWHVVERDDEGGLAVACGVAIAPRERQTVPVDSLLGAGRICLDCAQALLRAG